MSNIPNRSFNYMSKDMQRILHNAHKAMDKARQSNNPQPEKEDPDKIRLAPALASGKFTSTGFGIYKEADTPDDYGRIWVKKTFKDPKTGNMEEWLVVYEDDEDRIIRQLASQGLKKSASANKSLIKKYSTLRDFAQFVYEYFVKAGYEDDLPEIKKRLSEATDIDDVYGVTGDFTGDFDSEREIIDEYILKAHIGKTSSLNKSASATSVRDTLRRTGAGEIKQKDIPIAPGIKSKSIDMDESGGGGTASVTVDFTDPSKALNFYKEQGGNTGETEEPQNPPIGGQEGKSTPTLPNPQQAGPAIGTPAPRANLSSVTNTRTGGQEVMVTREIEGNNAVRYSFLNEKQQSISLNFDGELRVGQLFIRPDTGKTVRLAGYRNVIVKSGVEDIVDKLMKEADGDTSYFEEDEKEDENDSMRPQLMNNTSLQANPLQAYARDFSTSSDLYKDWKEANEVQLKRTYNNKFRSKRANQTNPISFEDYLQENWNKFATMLVEGHVVEEGGKWYVYNKDKTKKLSRGYNSKKEADHRLQQIEYFKHKGSYQNHTKAELPDMREHKPENEFQDENMVDHDDFGNIVASLVRESVSPPGRGREVEEIAEKGTPKSEAEAIAWKQYKDTGQEAEDEKKEASLNKKSVSPPGWKGTTEHMKEHDLNGINPYQLAWSMEEKGDTPHYTEEGKKKEKYKEHPGPKENRGPHAKKHKKHESSLKLGTDISDEIPPMKWEDNESKKNLPPGAKQQGQNEEVAKNDKPDIAYDSESEDSGDQIQITVDPKTNQVTVKNPKGPTSQNPGLQESVGQPQLPKGVPPVNQQQQQNQGTPLENQQTPVQF